MIDRFIQQFQSGKFILTGQWDGPAGFINQVNKLPAVIFCHGFTGNRFESRRMYALLSAKLAEAGFLTFRFDHRGCGESQGDFQDFDTDGFMEDLDSALEVFLANDKVDLGRTAVVGFSLGGLSANYLLFRRPEFCTAALWNAVAQPDIIRDRLATYPDFENYRSRGYLNYMGFRVSADYIDNIGKLNPLEWTKEFKRPVFFVQGSDDPIVKPSQVQLFMNARNNETDKLIMIPGGDHFFSTADNIDYVLRETEIWLRTHLLTVI